MLGTYFGIVLAIFVVMIVGAVLGYTSSSSFEEYIKDPLQNSLGKYVDNPTESQKAEAAYKSAWNAAQKDVRFFYQSMTHDKINSRPSPTYSPNKHVPVEFEFIFFAAR